MKNRIPGALLMLGMACAAQAQELGELRGKVKDQAGEPIVGASVYIQLVEGLIGTTSDVEGRWLIKPLEPGSYTVHFSFAGSQQVEILGVQVHPGKSRQLEDVVLLPAQLGIIDVVARVWEPPLIDPEDPVKLTFVASQFKKDAVRKEPLKLITSFSPHIYRSPNSEDLHFKGSRSDAMGFFVDGVKMTSLRGVPPSAIASVTIYTGGLPARYGDVTGGVVSIETQSYFDLYRQRQAGLR